MKFSVLPGVTARTGLLQRRPNFTQHPLGVDLAGRLDDSRQHQITKQVVALSMSTVGERKVSTPAL
jgi:hypothetical protein